MVKAIRIHQHGGADVLTYEDVELPPPAKGEVRIRHTAIGVNFIDIYYRTGLYAAPSMPFTPGNEGAGVVINTAKLQATDVDTPAAERIYTLGTATTKGQADPSLTCAAWPFQTLGVVTA